MGSSRPHDQAAKLTSLPGARSCRADDPVGGEAWRSRRGSVTNSGGQDARRFRRPHRFSKCRTRVGGAVRTGVIHAPDGQVIFDADAYSQATSGDGPDTVNPSRGGGANSLRFKACSRSPTSSIRCAGIRHLYPMTNIESHRLPTPGRLGRTNERYCP